MLDEVVVEFLQELENKAKEACASFKNYLLFDEVLWWRRSYRVLNIA
jgi:hypothetical protein